jgi:primosomal protein N' (replication factor Y)
MCRSLRRKDRVRKLRHLNDLPQARLAETKSIAQPGDRLECHYCGFRRTVPKTCPKCQSEHLYYLGAGSQQGEERLQELFPNARIGRMDRDTVRGRHDMERLLARLHSGEINLLVGTQMIAKGHDIHGVTLVGVVGADFALGLPDFRAAERVFQLLTQVSGRAGRGEPPRPRPRPDLPPRPLRHPVRRHPRLPRLRRQGAAIPPLDALPALRRPRQRHHPKPEARRSRRLGRHARPLVRAAAPLDKIRVLGPAAAPIARLKRIYRFHFSRARRDAGRTGLVVPKSRPATKYGPICTATRRDGANFPKV